MEGAGGCRGLPKADYEGAKSTLCLGCGHDVITKQIVNAFYAMGVEPHQDEKKRRRMALLNQAWRILQSPWSILAGMIDFGRSNETSDTTIKRAPNVQTMAAPEGKSHQKEKKSPPTPPINAMSQPIKSLRPSEPARLIPQTAGTIR